MKILKRIFLLLIFCLLIQHNNKINAEESDSTIKKTIESLGLSNEKIVKKPESRSADNDTVEYVINNTSKLVFKKDGSLLRLSRSSELDLEKKGEYLEETEKVQILNSLNDIIPEGFTLKEEQDILGGEGTKFIFANDKNGIENKYNLVIVTVENSTGRIISYNRREELIENTTPNITEDDVKIIANDYLTKLGLEFKLVDIKLSIDKFKGKDEETPRLMYKLIYDMGDELWIDAIDGNVIFFNTIKKDGRAFYIYDKLNSENADNLKGIMSILGYNSSSYAYKSKNVVDFLNGYHSYAFTFSGHGSSNSITDNKGQTNKPSDVSGVWNFVFLDACSTAATTEWSDAFKIYNDSSNSIFMGWYENVGESVSNRFCRYLYRCVKRNSSITFYKNIWNAFEEGDDYYPLRFRGDKNWNGKI